MTSKATTSLQVTDDPDYQLPSVDTPAMLREHRGKYLNAIVFDNEYRMIDFIRKELDDHIRPVITSRSLFRKSRRTERIQMIFISLDSLIDNPFYGVYHNETMILSKEIKRR